MLSLASFGPALAEVQKYVCINVSYLGVQVALAVEQRRVNITSSLCRLAVTHPAPTRAVCTVANTT